MHLEPPVLPATRPQLDEREQRVVLVEHAVRGEMDDFAFGCQSPKRAFRRRRAYERRRPAAVCPLNRGDLLP